MSAHDHFLDEAPERAALYAAGALPEAERQAFDEHLASGCVACAAELDTLLPAVAALASGVRPMVPDPQVRADLLRRVAGSTGSPLRRHLAREGQDADLFVQRAAEAPWEASDVPGVHVRVLYADAVRDQFTALVRMAPGAWYPEHVHGGPEECLVLEGDLRVGPEVLGPGDYQRAAAGSRHGVQSTECGCLLLVTSSLADEFG